MREIPYAEVPSLVGQEVGVSDWLEITQDRIDSDSFVLEPAPIDVPGLMAWVLDNGLQLSPGHPLQMQLGSGLPALHGDQVLLRIMLMNLVSNAFKYSPEGAPVALHAWQQGDRLCLLQRGHGAGGVNATTAGAVVMNMTIANPTQVGYLTVFPTGTVRPQVSSINFTQ